MKGYTLFWAHVLFFYKYGNLNSIQFTRNVLRSVSLPASVRVSSGSTLWRSKPFISKNSGMLTSCLMELQPWGQIDWLLLPLDKTTCFYALVLTSFKISRQSVLPSYYEWKQNDISNSDTVKDIPLNDYSFFVLAIRSHWPQNKSGNTDVLILHTWWESWCPPMPYCSHYQLFACPH